MGVTGLRSAAEIVVEGRVQGVGYRDFVQRKAASLGLAGYVMNLKDGKVRVRVEGGRDLIEELMHDLGKVGVRDGADLIAASCRVARRVVRGAVVLVAAEHHAQDVLEGLDIQVFQLGHRAGAEL